MLNVKITVVVDRDGDSFYAHCPGLKGLHVDGSTKEEAIDNAIQAATLYVESMICRNDPLPIGVDFSAEERALRPTSTRRSLSRNVVYGWIRIRVRLAIGAIYNLAGIPGLVRECDYEAGVTDATIKVRVRDLFTVIEVNGLELYFHRLTGTIDGVGTMCGYRPGPAHQLGTVPEPLADAPGSVRTGSQ